MCHLILFIIIEKEKEKEECYLIIFIMIEKENENEECHLIIFMMIKERNYFFFKKKNEFLKFH